MAWTNASFMLGPLLPYLSFLSKEENDEIQKKYYDHMCRLSLIEIYEMIVENGFRPPFPHKTIVDSLNEGKFSNMNDAKSFKQMMLIELYGSLSVIENELGELFIYYCEKKSKECENEKNKPVSEYGEKMKNLIFNYIKKYPQKTDLPTIRIQSLIHAALRWDKQLKYDKNDMEDIGHATSAIPYCDYFFTEKKLAHLTTQKILSLNKKFKCAIQSSPDDCLKLLEII